MNSVNKAPDTARPDNGHPFGDALCRYREEAGLSLAALALELGRRIGERVDPQKVNSWEHGSLPNVRQRRDIIEALEEILEVPGRDLLKKAGFLLGSSVDDLRITRLEERLARQDERLADVEEMLRQLIELLGPQADGRASR